MSLKFAERTPTADDVRAFVAAVNKGRTAAGLLPIGTLDQLIEAPDGCVALDFDACEPSHPDACLSATYLATPLGFISGGDTFLRAPYKEKPGPKQVAALKAAGAEPANRDESFLAIPETILRVTDPFDYEHDHDGVRAAFVEAGYIE